MRAIGHGGGEPDAAGRGLAKPVQECLVAGRRLLLLQGQGGRRGLTVREIFIDLARLRGSILGSQVLCGRTAS